MMSLDKVLKKIGETLREKLPSSIFVAEHVGEFRETELDRYSVTTPAIIVSTRGIRTSKFLGTGVLADLEILLFLITKPTSTRSATEIGLELQTFLFKLIPYETFGLEARRGTEMRSDNLYDPALDDRNVSVWSFEFVLPIQVQQISQCEIDQLDEFLRLDADIDYNIVSGSNDPDGTADFEQTILLSGSA